MAGWKIRVDLGKIVASDGKFDKRTLRALLRAANRLLQHKDAEKKIQGNMMRGFHSIASCLVDVSSDHIKHMPEDSFKAWLRVVDEEGLKEELPVTYQRALLTRCCNERLAKEDFKQVLAIMSPFAASTKFNIYEPTLCAVSSGKAEKLNTFSKLAQDVLLPGLADGAQAKQRVREFCMLCSQTFENEAVELVALDHATAACWSSSSAVWHALAALADETKVTVEHQVGSLETLWNHGCWGCLCVLQSDVGSLLSPAEASSVEMSPSPSQTAVTVPKSSVHSLPLRRGGKQLGAVPCETSRNLP